MDSTTRQSLLGYTSANQKLGQEMLDADSLGARELPWESDKVKHSNLCKLDAILMTQ